MEFEALTGQSLALFDPQVLAPYQNFVTGLTSYPSAVGWFAEHGHAPIAVHPYTHRDLPAEQRSTRCSASTSSSTTRR